MRLDQFLVEKNFFHSRAKAKEAIQAGKVSINGKFCTKPAYLMNSTDKIDLNQNDFVYVSRSGYKLEAALQHWQIDVEGKNCLDVGSSTGGFTQCLLRFGAKNVVAVDVGTNQMVTQLATDKRVKLFENADIRLFKLPPRKKIDLVTVDVSFVSLTKIVPSLLALVPLADFLFLFKPQFEVGRENLKQGVFKGKNIDHYLQNFGEFLTAQGLKSQQPFKVPLTGKEGNQEFFFYSKSGTTIK